MSERYKDDRDKYRSLYCTREQGDKILELTNVYPMNFWVDNEKDDRAHGFMESVYDFEYVEDSSRYKYKVHPAYTLQELRDVAKETHYEKLKAIYDKFEREGVLLIDSFDHHKFENLLQEGNAPEFAAWVIEWLEEVER